MKERKKTGKRNKHKNNIKVLKQQHQKLKDRPGISTQF